MGTPFKPGVPAIQVLQSDLATVDRTVYLPTPTTVKLDWKEKAIRQELVSGAERIRRIGYVPVLTMAWKVFQDVNEERYPLGNANGNTLRLQDLLDICNLGGGRLRVSPGPGAGETYSVTAQGFGVGNGSTTAFQLQQAAGRRESYGWQGYVNVPTTPRTNLVLQSQTLGVTWTVTGTSITADTAAAPDGTTTADKIKEDATTGIHSSQQNAITIVSGQNYTASVYLKAGGRQWVAVQLTSGFSTNPGAYFDLTNGVVGNLVGTPVGTPTITPLGNGWYRVTVTGLSTGASGGLTVFNASANGTVSYTGDNVSGALAWGAQLETGLTPTPYIPTTSAAVTVTPAYWPALGDGFDPVYALSGAPSIYRQDWQGNVLLYNTARTNVCLQSQNYTVTWNLNLATRTANVGTAPDGTSTLNRLVETATTGVHAVYLAQSSINNGDWVTASVHVSQYSNRSASITLYGAAFPGGSAAIQFNPTTGAIEFTYNAAGCTYGVIQLAGGVYRIWFRRQATATGTFSIEHDLAQPGVSNSSFSYAGDGVSGVNLWGTMVEINSPSTTGPTAYIPTTTAAVTFTDYTLSATGLVTFTTAPLTNAVLTWSGSFTGPRKAFRGFVTKAPNLRPVGPSIATDVEVEFTGYDVFSSPTLENF